jgi:Scavenger mRNA decapping enzyme C-term binding
MQFDIDRVLYENEKDKKIGILFKCSNNGDREGDLKQNGILEVEATCLQKAHLPAILQLIGEHLEKQVAAVASSGRKTTPPSPNYRVIFQNDKWSSYLASFQHDFKLAICYPASTKDILKKEAHSFKIIAETPNIYANIVLPYLKEHEIGSEHNVWIHRILDGQSEADLVIRRHPQTTEEEDAMLNYVLLPDSKWADRNNLKDLYLLCIVGRRDLYSLRDLSSIHLPLLRYLKAEIREALKSHFNLDWSDVKVFIHYLPTFFHLHLHIVQNLYDGPTLQIGNQTHVL